MRFAGRSETARDRIGESGRHQLVPNFGRSGRDMVQTVVTHRWNSFSCARPECLSAKPPDAWRCPDFPELPPCHHLLERRFVSDTTRPLATHPSPLISLLRLLGR